MRRCEEWTVRLAVRWSAALMAALVSAGALTGCVAVGYSSGGGWFVWPGGLGLLVILLVLFFLLRGRR